MAQRVERAPETPGTPETPGAARPEPDLLPVAWSALWKRLPLVCAMDGVVAVAAVPALASVSAGRLVLGALCCVAFLGPALAGCVAVADDVVRRGPDDGGSVADLGRALWWRAPGGMAVTGAPVAFGMLTAVTVFMWSHGDGPGWLLAPLAVDCVALALSCAACLPALALREATGLRGRQLWWTALGVVAAAPLQVAGVLAVGAVAWVLAGVVGGGLLLLVPGPVALLVSATVRTALARSTPPAP